MYLLLNTYRLLGLSKMLHGLSCSTPVITALVRELMKFLEYVPDMTLLSPAERLSDVVSLLYRLAHGNDLKELSLARFIRKLLIYELYQLCQELSSEHDVTYVVADPHTLLYLRDCASAKVVYGLPRVLDYVTGRSNRVNVDVKVVVYHPCQIRNDTELSETMGIVERFLDWAGFRVEDEFFTETSAICCGSFTWLTYPHIYLKVASRCLRRLLKYARVVITYCPFCYANLRYIAEKLSLRKLHIVDIHEVALWLSTCGGKSMTR